MEGLLKFVILLHLLLLTHNVSFQSLYERELKSTYGFEILKHYHDEQFGDEDVKQFTGESMLFMTPWYFCSHSGGRLGRNSPSST
jgi:hypothetical protein